MSTAAPPTTGTLRGTRRALSAGSRWREKPGLDRVTPSGTARLSGASRRTGTTPGP